MMQHTYLATLHHVESKIQEMSRVVGGLEASQERLDALEALYDARKGLRDVMTCIDTLATVRASLESNGGYTDQWFDLVNCDGDFLDFINVDPADLIGSVNDKTEACMEGIFSTIWGWIKKAFEFIINLFNKICNFIRSLVNIFRSKKSDCDKIIAAFERLEGIDMNAIMKVADEEMNRYTIGGHNQNGSPDIREVYNRMQLSICLAAHLIQIMANPIFEIESKQRDDRDDTSVFHPQFAALASHAEQSTLNPIMSSLMMDLEVEAFNSKAVNSVSTYPSGTSIDAATGKTKINYTLIVLMIFIGNSYVPDEKKAHFFGIKELANRCGYKLKNDGGKLMLTIKDLNELKHTTFVELFPTSEKVVQINEAAKKIFGEIDVHNKQINEQLVLVNKKIAIGKNNILNLAQMIDVKGRTDDGKLDLARANTNEALKISKYYVQWMSEATSAIATLMMDLSRCMNYSEKWAFAIKKAMQTIEKK